MFPAMVAPSPAISCLLSRRLLRTGRCLVGKHGSSIDESAPFSAASASDAHSCRQFRRGLCSVLPATHQSGSFHLRSAGVARRVIMLNNRPAVCGRNGAPFLNTAFARSFSASSDSDPLPPPSPDYIPPAPTLPEFGGVTEEPLLLEQTLNRLGEPTLSSVGLGGWSPSGLMQHFFDLIHVSTAMPWWASIAAGTVLLRFCIMPLVIKSQRNMIKLRNNMEEMNVYQAKISDARRMGNDMEVNVATQKMMLFMREKEINPLKNFLVPVVQAPVFISVFFALRRMTSLPLASFMTGGTLWFTDLTVCDPYYALPVVTTLTMCAIIEMGSEGISPTTLGASYVRYIMRALPFVMLPFIWKFPAAILCYWCTSNFMALLMVLFLRIPAVRQYFQIPKILPPKPKPVSPDDKLSFVKRAKRDWGDMRSAQKLQNRQQYDEMKFQRAGIGPIVKTYKYDPTKKQP